jgi:hypothetical protein
MHFSWHLAGTEICLFVCLFIAMRAIFFSYMAAVTMLSIHGF